MAIPLTGSATSIPMAMVLARPLQVIANLRSPDAPIFGLTRVDLTRLTEAAVTLDFEFRPWPVCARAGYPSERVRLIVTSQKWAIAIPLDDGTRRWKHRYPVPTGELCLWYDEDPRSLRWEWDDGLLPLLTITHRHLLFEEFWRREGRWPVEDAPHGHGRHRVRSEEMQEASRRWAR